MFASDAFMPYLPALAAWGVAPDALLWLRARTAAEQLWCTEQALRSQDVRVVLAWLPRCLRTSPPRCEKEPKQSTQRDVGAEAGDELRDQ